MDLVVNIELAGTLNKIISEPKAEITCLTITGQINSKDIRFIRDELSNLNALDFENAVIVEYFGKDGTSVKEEMFYAADTIPKYAFLNTKILTFRLPKSILSIGDYAFKSCGIRREYNSVGYYPCKIPNSVINIGKEAFCFSTNFWELEIPASVKNIDVGAFKGCSFVSVERDSPYYICNQDTDWILYDIKMSVILHVPDHFGFHTNNEPTRFKIPNTVVKIDNGAFINCYLNQITIPKTLKVIDDEAFMDCKDLKIVEFDNNSELEYIGEKSFNLCSALEYINLPNSVKYIGERALYGCFKSINISSKVDYIGRNAISPSDILKFITIWREKPLDIEDCVFSDFERKKIFDYCTLFVPVNSVELYKMHTYWGNFKTILPIIKDNIQIYNKDSGELLSNLGDKIKSITNLTIKGFINAIDFKTLRDELPLLSFLDISDVVIDECYEYSEYTFRSEFHHKNSIPRNAFYKDGWESNEDFYNYYFIQLSRHITNIILPVSITDIGQNAFRGCAIESIVIPSEVENIENNAFSECDKLETLIFKNVNRITQIGKSAFSSCSSLKSIVIPTFVKSIEENCFCGCTSLENIEIAKNSNINSIKKYAFNECKSLISFTIRSTIESIEEGAFSDCNNLKELIFEPNSIITKIGGNAFTDCYNLKEITLPSSIEIIGEYAFLNCKNLSSINWSSKIKLNSIEEGTFKSCSKLKSVYIPSNIKLIDKSAFEKCIGLKILSIPNSVENIGDFAFNSCESLLNINIPESLLVVGKSAFMNCKNVEEIYISSSVNRINEEAFYNCSGNYIVEDNNKHYCSLNGVLFNKDITELINFPINKGTSYKIPDSVKYIHKYAFCKCNLLKEVVFTSSVIHIGEKAFSECEGLTIINIPSTIKYIKRAAFEKCVKLKEISFDISIEITEIDENLFEYCNELKSINIPTSVRLIKSNAFNCCTNLSAINFHADSKLERIYYGAFSECKKLKTIKLPASVCEIQHHVFENCITMKTIEIPANITNLGYRLFYKCINLEYITIPSSIKTISSSAFMYCSRLKEINFEDDSLLEVIEHHAFYECENIEVFNFGSKVREIGEYSFYGCSKLKSITIASEKKISKIGDFAFSYCDSQLIENIPYEIKNINQKAF